MSVWKVQEPKNISKTLRVHLHERCDKGENASDSNSDCTSLGLLEDVGTEMYSPRSQGNSIYNYFSCFSAQGTKENILIIFL